MFSGSPSPADACEKTKFNLISNGKTLVRRSVHTPNTVKDANIVATDETASSQAVISLASMVDGQIGMSVVADSVMHARHIRSNGILIS